MPYIYRQARESADRGSGLLYDDLRKQNKHENRYDTGAAAVRSYDRNGVALVTNKYSYDVSFEATTLPAKNADKNPLIMSVITRVRDFGAEYDTPEGPFTLERNGEKFVFSWNTSYLL